MIRLQRMVPLALMSLMLLLSCPAQAADQRVQAQALKEQQQQVVAQAEAEQQQAEEQARRQLQALARDRDALTAAVNDARQNVVRLKKRHKNLRQQEQTLAQQQAGLEKTQKEQRLRLQELLGFIRLAAKDADGLLSSSQLNALNPQRTAVLNRLQQQDDVPAMDDVSAMSQGVLDEMRGTGEVQIVEQTIVDRQGESRLAQVLLLGDFSAAYRSDEESGFLLYSQASSRLFALSVLPARRWQHQIDGYLAGETAQAPIDVGRGASLRQLMYQTDFNDQLSQGGFIVWPILLIGAVAVVLIGERSWFLRRNRFNGSAFLGRLEPMIEQGNWSGCEAACHEHEDKPLPRVLRAALPYRALNREDLENALQEAILGEIPRLERFLSTLAVLASIAPLLGLLGTVTGMINTFQVITFHGTGDPRLMSSGISEALVTTMLGLAVAIPIMLCHSLLSRRVEMVIGELEERAIRFVNVICKSRVTPEEMS
nr:MotA/TolQ/ExbB proton channel family protein [uncultured Desulfuromonas sp.]